MENIATIFLGVTKEINLLFQRETREFSSNRTSIKLHKKIKQVVPINRPIPCMTKSPELILRSSSKSKPVNLLKDPSVLRFYSNQEILFPSLHKCFLLPARNVFPTGKETRKFSINSSACRAFIIITFYCKF